ncbi:unannotated protein [freshwater metagenome]|uniref:Unannotated protein n=1 Tax=freshwater metagenome TaxID=449393 RepID=A0A6J7XYP2_9ZZZZ|nr:hypothetical protein [Actinomycetota bacterium]
MLTNDYVAGTCNIGTGEIRRRQTVALVGLFFSLACAFTLISTDSPRGARFTVFLPLMVASIGWVQSRRKFCLAYGFMGTFNFGRMGQISKVTDSASRKADRKTALSILLQSTAYALLITLVFVALPL